MKKKWKNVAQTKIRKDTWSTEFLQAQPKDSENKRGLLHFKQVCVLYTNMIKFKYSFSQVKSLYYMYQYHAVLCFQEKKNQYDEQ